MVELAEVLQFHRIDPALSRLALGYEGLGPAEEPGHIFLGQASILSGRPQQLKETLVIREIGAVFQAPASSE
ncbi:MAG TPA: hypothetical protein VFA15_05470 [Nitrososphaera sp.]|nr:hypothetical protein [Nitrososphaera sp.]